MADKLSPTEVAAGFAMVYVGVGDDPESVETGLEEGRVGQVKMVVVCTWLWRARCALLTIVVSKRVVTHAATYWDEIDNKDHASQSVPAADPPHP